MSTQQPVLPIAGASKAKRIAWSTAPNQISVSFLKLLRERNKTRKVYPVNPYVEVYRFQPNLYGLLNPNCDGGLDVWSWVVVGPKKALLVGTAFGLGDMKGLAETISEDKPLVVVNTHAGRDQVLGNCRFQTVYCHEYDQENIKRITQPNAWDREFDAAGKNRWMEFERNDLPKYRQYELIPVKDGHVFNLGANYDVEVLWTGGVTPGHSMLLDKHSRRLFPGDGVSSETMRSGLGPAPGMANGQYANLLVFRDQMSKVIARMPEFDYMYPARGFINLENYVLGDLHDTLDQIIAAPDVYNFKSMWTLEEGAAPQEVREKYVRGFATIAYTRAGLTGVLA